MNWKVIFEKPDTACAFIIAMTVCMSIVGLVAWNGYENHVAPGFCTDKVVSVDAGCKHPAQVLTPRGGQMLCLCPRPGQVTAP